MPFASFFSNLTGDTGLDEVATRSAAMLGDARHSFDLATLAVLTEADPSAVAEDIYETDRRINETEQDLRRALIVHVSVQGATDIGSVLGFTLLLKKIERIGDQAKNILELAEAGVSLAARPDVDQLLAERQTVSGLFAEAIELMGAPEPPSALIDDYATRCDRLTGHHRDVLQSCLTSEDPAREVVPLAIYVRYLRRIVANLLGVVRVSSEPLPTVDYLEDGEVDTDD